MVCDAITREAEDGSGTGQFDNEGICCTDRCVILRSKENVVLSNARDVNVAVWVNNDIGDILAAWAPSLDGPLEGAVHTVEFGDEHFRVRDVEGGPAEVRFP